MARTPGRLTVTLRITCCDKRLATMKWSFESGWLVDPGRDRAGAETVDNVRIEAEGLPGGYLFAGGRESVDKIRLKCPVCGSDTSVRQDRLGNILMQLALATGRGESPGVLTVDVRELNTRRR